MPLRLLAGTRPRQKKKRKNKKTNQNCKSLVEPRPRPTGRGSVRGGPRKRVRRAPSYCQALQTYRQAGEGSAAASSSGKTMTGWRVWLHYELRTPFPSARLSFTRNQNKRKRKREHIDDSRASKLPRLQNRSTIPKVALGHLTVSLSHHRDELRNRIGGRSMPPTTPWITTNARDNRAVTS